MRRLPAIAWFDVAPEWHLYANAMALSVFPPGFERLSNLQDPAASAYLAAAALLANRLARIERYFAAHSVRERGRICAPSD